MSQLNNNSPGTEPWGTPDSISGHELMYQIFQLSDYFIVKTMRSILQSISYMGDSRKLLKARLIKSLTHALGPNSFFPWSKVPLFRKNYQAVLSTVTLPEAALMFQGVFIKKCGLSCYKYNFFDRLGNMLISLIYYPFYELLISLLVGKISLQGSPKFRI